MTSFADALRRLALCRENQPGAWQVIVSRDIINALLAEPTTADAYCSASCRRPSFDFGPVEGDTIGGES